MGTSGPGHRGRGSPPIFSLSGRAHPPSRPSSRCPPRPPPPSVAAALFIAAVIAGAISPWYERLAARLKGRRQFAAGLTTAGILLIVVLPLASISVVLANEVAAGANYVRTTLRSEGVQGLVNDLPRPLRALAQKVMARLPQDQGDLQDLTQKQSGRAAAAVGGV